MVYPTQKEIDITSNFHVPVENGPYVDYKDILCLKPWGYEFLAYESPKIGIWCLSITEGHSTSLHCHFKKDTFIIVLKGCARIGLIDSVHALGVLESMYLPKGKFHALGTFAPETIILEIEIYRDPSVTFSDKNDLLRIDDQYKRKSVGYASSVELIKPDERHFWLGGGTRDLQVHGVNISVNSRPTLTSKYNILLKGDYYQNGIFYKEGTNIPNWENVYDEDCLVLSIDKPDWFEDCKIIYNMEQLAIISKNKKIALTSGCFDILHVGHIHNLKKAKLMGDYLFVCLSNDEQIKKLKGNSRPINNYVDRIDLFKTVNCVDYIILYNEKNIETEESIGNIMKIVDPCCWVKGDDYTESQILEKHPYLKKIKLIPNIELKSTTSIINKCQLSSVVQLEF